MTNRGYLRPAVAVVFRDRTWWWRALILAAVSSIPYLGGFLALGYYMSVMRWVALGGSGLPEVGEHSLILRRAVDGFVVTLVWSLAILAALLVAILVGLVAAASLGSGHIPRWVFVILMPVVSLISLPIGALLKVAVLRTAVYREIKAGLSLSGVFDLIRRHRRGFWRVTGLLVAVTVVTVTVGLPSRYVLLEFSLSTPGAQAVKYGWGFVTLAVTTPLWLVTYCAYGLWAKDTDPSTWPPLDVVPAMAFETATTGE